MEETKACACGGSMRSVGVHWLALDLSLIDSDVRAYTLLGKRSASEKRLELFQCDHCGKVEFYGINDPFHEEKPSPVEQYEQTFAKYSEAKLQKIIDDTEYLTDAKTAARNLLNKRKQS